MLVLLEQLQSHSPLHHTGMLQSSGKLHRIRHPQSRIEDSRRHTLHPGRRNSVVSGIRTDLCIIFVL